MSVSFRRSVRAPLRVEELEDRTTPSAVLSEDFAAFASNRVLVGLSSPAGLAAVSHSPLAQSVTALGGHSYSVSLNAGVTVGEAITLFSAADGVLFAEADYTLGVQAIPNDPNFGSNWGLNNTGQTGGTADADIDAPEAWDTARGTGQHIVAVIDTGVLYTHPDLAANIWRNAGEIAGDGIDNDENGYVDDLHGYDFVNNDGNPTDDNGHGTHVAGTIGAVGNNGIGTSGVAWTTKIMALKFLGANGSGSTSGAVSAIYYAVDNGATILNNSWGGGGYSQTLYDAIAYAQASGVIFVAAAGNAASDNDTVANYPSNYAVANVVAVASTTATDGLSSFSNYGANTVALGAPGSSIYSTYLNNGYATLSGTSMATPHVAGALAVYWDANPNATAAQVIQRLKDTVDPIAALTGRTSTGGRLNLNKLLNGTSPPPPPPPPADTNGARVVSGAFSGTATTDFNRVRLTFNEAIDANSFTAADVVALSGPGGAGITPTGVSAVGGSNGTQFDVAFAAQSGFGTYSITVGPDILDLAGNAMNQNQNAVNGEATADRYTTNATITPPRQTFTYTGAAVAIRDLQTSTVNVVVPSTSVIAGMAITDVNVTVTLTHTYDKDLQISLVAPNGKSVQLFNRRGGSADNLTGTTFDDEASTTISAGAAPFRGSFRPEQLLSGFDGAAPVGTWQLRVADVTRQDVGSITGFSFSIATGAGGNSVQSYGFREADGSTLPPTEPKIESMAATILPPAEPDAAIPEPVAPIASPAPIAAAPQAFVSIRPPALIYGFDAMSLMSLFKKSTDTGFFIG